MRKLSSQILLSQALILTFTILVGFALFVHGERTRLDRDFEQRTASAALRDELPLYALWFGLALAAGFVASVLLAQRLKRRTFGLELDEIAQLLREREAVVHGIREGMIAFDQDGRVSMVNDE